MDNNPSGNLSAQSLRYIVFLIDSKTKEHDGVMCASIDLAKEYAHECISEKYCTKAVIGMVCLDNYRERLLISKVETIGFTGDKKDVNQLELFK